MIRVSIARGRIRYPVQVSPGLLARAGPALRKVASGGPILVVTDRNVARLHGGRFLASLRRAGFVPRVLSITPGEGSKTFETVRRLCEQWSRWSVSRSTLVAAVGGGVVTDVAGFAASVYTRGLEWVAFPTTLLAQADAAIGGKVGVNLPAGKNLLGAFHHPRAVYCDPEALTTLSRRAFRSGLAEVLKIGVIRRPSVLAQLRRSVESGDWSNPRVSALVRAAAREKARCVSADPEDRGVRQHLNFGHTVGHAIEASSHYRGYTHGEAVAIGMAAALRLSVRMAGLDPRSARDVEELLRSIGLPVRLRRMPGTGFWSALEKDKKRGRAPLRMVLSPAIGAAKTYELHSLTRLRDVISSLVQKP